MIRKVCSENHRFFRRSAWQILQNRGRGRLSLQQNLPPLRRRRHGSSCVSLSASTFIKRIAKGVRPVLIVSNNVNNHYSPLVEGIPFTTAINDSKLRQPQNVFFKADKRKGLAKDSLLLTNFKWPLNKYQLIECLGSFEEEDMVRVAQATICQNPYMRLALNEDFLNSPLLQRIISYVG